MSSKRKIQTKYKLPSLNWVALRAGQVKGTVFSEIDDEDILKVNKTSQCLFLSATKRQEDRAAAVATIYCARLIF